MKTSLNFLPREKRQQILDIVAIIKEVVAPEKIILFGSYAKGKYVQHRYTGKDGIFYEYVSDFDFLVVTKNNTVKEYELEDIVNSRTQHFRQPVNLQIHEIDYINEGLEFGQYFFTDIVNEGVLLYDTDIVHFAEPKELTPEEEKEIAQRYFDIWFKSGSGFLNTVSFNLKENEYKIGAFILHQATESFYYTTLLVFTGYKPKTHNLLKLRKQAKHLSEEIFLLFAVETSKNEKYLFDLLKRGYVDARYKDDYIITREELSLLLERIHQMKIMVEKICMEKIKSIN
ncbi:HEPN domain protein [mine drainage metagenome]|uniref:HEPN domain protein n=1 Tax=mine drainage metagenome TaxID=410659 RepID=A0A1J5SBB3_9ZZZZ